MKGYHAYKDLWKTFANKELTTVMEPNNVVDKYAVCVKKNNVCIFICSTLTFFQFYCKVNRNQLKVFVKSTYGLYHNKYFEIINLRFWERSLVMRCFELHSNSQRADEIKGLPISIDFRNRGTEFLILFSMISTWLLTVQNGADDRRKFNQYWRFSSYSYHSYRNRYNS